MTKKESNSTAQTTNKTPLKWGFQKILDCLAYFGTACIAISLILSLIFSGDKTGSLYIAFKTIGDAIAYTLAVILAGFWVRRKRHIAWLLCYIVFVVVIVVMYIVTLVT